MKNPKTLMIILLCVGILFNLVGFFTCTTNPDNVFLGIAVMGIASIILLSAIIPAAKLIQQQNKEKEDRLKRLEEEVDKLKKNNSH